jgi:hypothetical protein
MKRSGLLLPTLGSVVLTGLVLYAAGWFSRPAAADAASATCCRFTRDHRDRAATLRPGQAVRVRGVCRGMNLPGVRLGECEFMNSPTNPLPSGGSAR